MRNRSEQSLARVGGRAAELKDRRLDLGSLHDPGRRLRNIFQYAGCNLVRPQPNIG
jgi:hypothetical protein